MKNTPGKGKQAKEWSWKEHRLWCEKVWEDGPEKARLREVARRVKEVQEQFIRDGTPEKVPIFEEGRDPGIISEVYYMHHLPSAKGYVGLAYHGAHERMKTHWNGRNKETDPCSTMLSTSVNPFEWIVWPVERFPGRR